MVGLWLWLPILAALIWSFVSVIDKYILGHELRDPILATISNGMGVFLIFSTVVALMGSSVFIPTTALLSALLAGVFYMFANWAYYYVMRREEVSRVTTLLALVPLIVLVLATLFLGETFGSSSYLGIFSMVAGAAIISINKSSKFKVKSIVWIVILAALFYSLRTVTIKFATLDAEIWAVIFWVGIGAGLTCTILFALHHPHIRKKAQKGEKHIFLVGTLAAIALLIFTHALAIGPASLAAALLSFQPLFVFIIATALTLSYPKIVKEKITKQIIIQKLVAMALIIAGSILII
jgi:drug/metabolite transporter (DMT)-like permease